MFNEATTISEIHEERENDEYTTMTTSEPETEEEHEATTTFMLNNEKIFGGINKILEDIRAENDANIEEADDLRNRIRSITQRNDSATKTNWFSKKLLLPTLSQTPEKVKIATGTLIPFSKSPEDSTHKSPDIIGRTNAFGQNGSRISNQLQMTLKPVNGSISSIKSETSEMPNIISINAASSAPVGELIQNGTNLESSGVLFRQMKYLTGEEDLVLTRKDHNVSIYVNITKDKENHDNVDSDGHKVHIHIPHQVLVKMAGAGEDHVVHIGKLPPIQGKDQIFNQTAS